MTAMTRVACSLLLFAALWLSATSKCCADEPTAKFVSPPKQVKGHRAEVKIEVSKAALEEVDVWVGVVPVSASSTIWLQGSGVDTPSHEEIVHLGRDIKEDAKQRYQVRVVSFPRGTIKSDGPVKMSEARIKGMRTLASVVIERTE